MENLVKDIFKYKKIQAQNIQKIEDTMKIPDLQTIGI